MWAMYYNVYIKKQCLFQEIQTSMFTDIPLKTVHHLWPQLNTSGKSVTVYGGITIKNIAIKYILRDVSTDFYHIFTLRFTWHQTVKWCHTFYIWIWNTLHIKQPTWCFFFDNFINNIQEGTHVKSKESSYNYIYIFFKTKLKVPDSYLAFKINMFTSRLVIMLKN